MAFSKARRLAQLLGSDGTVASGKIPADAIDGTKIADDAINSEHYTDISIDTAHIGDDQVTAAKLANAINTDIATGVTANTTANAALPKAGGAMTGAITTNSTFDGVDIATRDALLTSTISDVALKATIASPTLTGTPAAPTASGSTSTTQLATTAFVQQELTTLIGGAPSTLNDLNELAAAINDDANYNSTLTTALATKLPLAGGTMTGNIAHAGTFAIDVGGDIHLDADGGTIRFKDGGTTFADFTNNSGDLLIQSKVQDKDIVFYGDDNGTGFTALTLDMSDAGTATFNSHILLGNNTLIPASNFADETGIALKNSATVPQIQVSSDVVAMQLGRTSTGGSGQILALRSASTTKHSFTTTGYDLTGALAVSGQTTLTGVTNIASSATASALLTVHNSFSSDANNALLVRGGANESDGKVLEVQDHAGNSDFVVMGDGKVGIGTTNPYATLRVKLAAARATGYDPDNALTWADVMVVNPSGADTSATGIGFYNNGSYHANAASGIALVKHTASTDYGSDMAFIVRPQAAVAQEWMRLTSTGRLGIGTTDPTHKFHVADGNNYAVLGDTQDNSTMSLRMADTTTFPVEVQAYSSELRFNTATTSGATPSAKMRIMPSGYVHVDGASDLRFTLGSQGTAGNNDSNWLRGNGTTLSYNSASGDHIWEIGGTEHMRLDSAASASVPQLEIKDTHPWIDMVAPDGSVFKSGITMRGGSSSTQAQSHFHLTRDSGYRTLASAGNYDTYIDTTTANTVYGNFLIGTNNTEAIRVLATNQYVGIGNQAPTKQLVVMSSTDSNQMLVHLNNDTAGASSAIYFKADSQITGNSNTFTRAKGGIFFSRISTRGTGHMYLAVDGVNSDTNASPGGAQLKLTSNPNHGGGLVLKNSAHTVVGRDYTNGVLTNGQSVSWNGSGTTKTDSLLNMNGVGGNGGAWIAGISVSSADGSPSGAAVQVGVHGMTFNAFSTLVNQFDSGLSVTIGAQISISNTSGDTVYYRVNVIPLGSRETTVYGR
mgnify:CR=1 FL=1